ncbi:hypothetical protein NE237_018517 [Protea cynaroides]|uniref:Uncharacterized protein n=1 Tax=Protea cynaroides TaxID=273540 RepID=A0A9Q0K9Z9_9MAGN|nr:hypothetical protein NE237_018517 [Protea cynaroides]
MLDGGINGVPLQSAVRCKIFQESPDGGIDSRSHGLLGRREKAVFAFVRSEALELSKEVGEVGSLQGRSGGDAWKVSAMAVVVSQRSFPICFFLWRLLDLFFLFDGFEMQFAT